MRLVSGMVAWLCFAAGAACGQSSFTPTSAPVNGGKRATADLPTSQHMRNIGGSDGAGLCVFTSVEHAARWQNLETLAGFQAWASKRPGGSWPEKLDRDLAAFASAKGLPAPDYVQHTGGDESFLEMALRTGRMPGVTYAGRDDFYRSRIAHMVNLVYMDADAACIVDNNRPGLFVWMTRKDFLSRWRDMQGGWAVVLLAPPPPPYTESPVAFGQQCLNGRCITVEDGWQRYSDGSGWAYWRGGTHVATYRDGKVYAVENGGSVTDRIVPPPAPLPEGVAVVAAPPVPPAEPNFGVDPAKIHNAPRYAINGQEVSQDEATAAVRGRLADDSTKANLAVVGDPTFHAAVKAEVGKLPEETRAKLNVQYYKPESWAVSQFGLAPGVTLRDSDAPSIDRKGKSVGTIPVEAFDGTRLRTLLALLKLIAPLVLPDNPILPLPRPPDIPVVPGPAGGINIVWLLLAAAAAYIFWKGRGS